MFLNKIDTEKIFKTVFCNKLLILVFIFIFTIIILTFRDYGISWDEKDQMNLGDAGLSYYLSLGMNKSYFNLFPGFIEVYATRGPIFETTRSFFSVVFNKHSVNFYHLFIAVFAFLTFYFIYKILFLITNHKLISTISPLFLMFMPRFWGDIFSNGKDITISVFVSVILFLSLLILKRVEKCKWYLFAFLGSILGMACSLRIVIVYLFVLFNVYYLLALYKNKKKVFSIFSKNVLISSFFFLLNLYVWSPYLQIQPLIGIIKMITASTQFPWVGKMLFEGNFILSTELPWYYLPKWILITTPLFILFLSIISFILLLRKDKKNNFIRLSTSFIILSFLMPVFLCIFMRPTIYDAWRHFLFLSVPLVLMSVLGLFYLVDFFRKNKIFTLFIYLFVFFGFLVTGISYIKLHPYEYSYFNYLVGGLNGAYGKYETDYWGKSFKEAVEWLNENTPNDKDINVKTCGHSFSSTYYMKDNLKFTDKIEDADYYVCYTRNGEHLLVDDNKTIHIIEREGIPLNYIKKLK